MEALIIIIILLVLGYSAGSITEKNHYKSIQEREKNTLHIPVVSMKKEEHILDPNRKVAHAHLVSGCVVVSIDYFKLVMASLRNLVGGNVRAYETLVDRGRREAVLRMKESAEDPDIIANVRVETSAIGQSADRGSVGSIEVFAYGTAVRYYR
jgi:uncharacterized protein YbjQ (UPF0145 family)